MNAGPSPQQWEELSARVATVEILASAQWTLLLLGRQPEERASMVSDLMISLEDRMVKAPSPAYQRAVIDCAERVLESALETCRGFDEFKSS